MDQADELNTVNPKLLCELQDLKTLRSLDSTQTQQGLLACSHTEILLSLQILDLIIFRVSV